MTPSRPDRARHILAAALDHHPADRDAFLITACDNDAALLAEVRMLLAAHEAMPTEFLAGSAVEGIAAGDLAVTIKHGPGTRSPVRPTAEHAGEMIGHYKLREQIGEGGFGTVWVADQEQPVRRRVALKIIKLGMDTKEVIARFEQERQALALMDHPNIARVLDAGATQTGRPYFVMELVRGVKITDYCDDKQLSTQERLELFITVCQAVQHAHQKGIIHRDLKPSNILVTVNDGVAVPKVIDFGVAKATQGRLSANTVYTQFQQMVGTPLYMSPEQAELTSLDIDTRSDIYALGVLLYELLTGGTPIDTATMAKAGMDEIRRLIREVDPPRPSMRMKTLDGNELTSMAKRRHTEPTKLPGALRGDLDWIVMKCLEKDRGRRYDTANGLALDLQRHLQNEVVIARPPTTAYLLSKLIRRNRIAFAAGAAIAASLVIGIAVSLWQAVRAKSAEHRAVAVLDELRASAPAFTDQARSLAAKEQYNEAIEKLDYAIKLQPDAAEFLVQKADLLQCQFNLAQAATTYRAALALRPGDARAKASAALCDELLAARTSPDGKLTLESLGRLRLAILQQQRPAAELMPVARLLGREKEVILAFWLERLKDLPISAEKPLKERLTVRDDGLLELDLKDAKINDLTPLAGMPLGSLTLWNCKDLIDFTPLRDFRKLTYLDLEGTQISDLSHLQGLSLEVLYLSSTRVSDLSALSGMKLKTLWIQSTRVSHLAPLKGMPLVEFRAGTIPVTDFSPLKGAPLESFHLEHSLVRDLSFLAGAPVKVLYLYGCYELRGFALLAQMKSLERLVLPQGFRSLPEAELAAIGALRTHPRLQWIQADPATSRGGTDRWLLSKATQPKEVFWKDWDREQAFLPALRNTGFDFSLTRLPDGATYRLYIEKQSLSDLSFLKDAPISELVLPNCKVADVSPIRNLPLRSLSLTGNPVSDIGPLRGMPIESLRLSGSLLGDLTPLSGLPLKELYLHGCPNITDVGIIGDIKTLEKLTVPPQARNIEALTNLSGLRMLAFDITSGSQWMPNSTAQAFWEEWPKLGWLRALNEAPIRPDVLRQLDNGTWEVDLHNAPISDLSMLRGARISILKLGNTSVADLAPLRGMPLQQLYLYNTKVTDLRPLEGMPLVNLHLTGTDITDISVMRGMPLRGLRLHNCAGLTDLSPLREAKELTNLTLPPHAKNFDFLSEFPNLARIGFAERSRTDSTPEKTAAAFWKDYNELAWLRRLRESGLAFKSPKQLPDGTWQVDLSQSSLQDLTLLRGGRISDLNIGNTAVTDLSPLRGMPLRRLVLMETPVTELAPLKELPISQLYLNRTKVADLSPLRGMPLTMLRLRFCGEIRDLSPLADSTTLKLVILPPNAKNVEVLQGLKQLERIGYDDAVGEGGMIGRPVEEFWEGYDKLRGVRAIPGIEDRLTLRTDGTWQLNLDRMWLPDVKVLSGTPITRLQCGETAITDLEPLRGLALRILNIHHTKVSDLSPLEGMPLEDLRINGTLVSDISVVRGMPLTSLRLKDCTNLTDLSPLAESKDLKALTLPPNAKDIEFLKKFPNLERLSFNENTKTYQPDKTAEEFWMEYDAKKR